MRAVNAAPVQGETRGSGERSCAHSCGGVQDGNLHLFRSTSMPGHPFLVIKSRAATDGAGCLPHLRRGRYRRKGKNVICRRAASAIYIPSIGQKALQSHRSHRMWMATTIVMMLRLSKAAEEYRSRKEPSLGSLLHKLAFQGSEL